MFKAECKRVVEYNLKVSKDIVSFCQWILDADQGDTFYNEYTIEELIDAIANRAPSVAITDDEINIEYE